MTFRCEQPSQKLNKSHKNPDHKTVIQAQMKKALNALKVKKATGIDGIPAWFLKQYSEDLAPVVHNIITSSIIQCKYTHLVQTSFNNPCAKNYSTKKC